VSLPRADDLFRPTAARSATQPETERTGPTGATEPAGTTEDAGEPAEAEPSGRRRSSGRVRHDEKMTVYITSEELLDLEHARLTLRRRHGLAVDRGRLVREAVALVLADLDANGDKSALVERLREA
jgi:hypothetical protein